MGMVEIERGLQDIFMTPKLNDFKETFSHSSIHQALMNSWKSKMQMQGLGMENETDRLERQNERKEGAGRNLSLFFDEWGWSQKP